MKKKQIVNFYDNCNFRSISLERFDYLNKIDDLIVSNSKNIKSILDLGSGDGVRIKKISDRIGCDDVTTVEISEKLNEVCKSFGFKTNLVEIEHFVCNQKFDLITCLWSVLGYTDTDKSIQKIKSLLSEKGIAFIDVNVRYNFSEYGFFNCFKNIFFDFFKVNYKKYFKVKNSNCEVYLFNYWELDYILKKNKLKYKKIYLNYKSGKKTFPFFGQVLYICTHNP